MAANDTVHPQPRRFVRDRLLEARYEGDRVLHLAFGVLRQRPVRQTEPLAHGGDDDVEPQKRGVGKVAEQREPAMRHDDRIEFVAVKDQQARSEEHTSELQSLMRISYAVFCLKKKKKNQQAQQHIT